MMNPEAPHRPEALAVLREPVFSPGMVEHDAAILEAAAAELAARGVDCRVVRVEELDGLASVPDLVLSMAEGEDSLARLGLLEERGALVLNSPASVRATRRTALLELAHPRGPLVEGVLVETDDGDRIPPGFLASGSAWIKRGDYHALGAGDVVRAESGDVKAALRALHARGIPRAVVQPHVPGDVVKFYGVAGSQRAAASAVSVRPFFRWFATSGAGPDAAAAATLQESAHAAARAAGLSIFGGDAILAAGSSPVLVDLNAWPSFWRCRADAARAIAELGVARLEPAHASHLA
jgi:hypothetical protein